MAKRFNSKLWHKNSKRMPKPLKVRSNDKIELTEETKIPNYDEFRGNLHKLNRTFELQP